MPYKTIEKIKNAEQHNTPLNNQMTNIPKLCNKVINNTIIWH